ncbi:hypothetical protein ACFWIJ_21875, partial [Streptomyces sp. NPDC127079]
MSGDGDDAVGDASADDAPGSGEEPVSLTPAGGVALADVDVLGRAASGLPVPDARGDASAEGVVPSLTAGPATEEPPSQDRAEPLGAGEFSTLPAGLSSWGPGPRHPGPAPPPRPPAPPPGPPPAAPLGGGAPPGKVGRRRGIQAERDRLHQIDEDVV